MRALIYLLESHCVQALLVLWTKIKRIEKEIFVLSCHYRLHYRRFRSAVYHMTELTVKHIYFYLILYQTLILCLPAHPCVQSYLFIEIDLGNLL